MHIGDTLHGFTLTRIEQVPDLESRVYLYEHKKSGASLMYLENEDVEKAFSIGFKTIPDTDTGIFHILEHSVLNGSEKYPVKEPFVDLLKSSMATFLNAMTFPDKTMYPIASTNEKDFLNLMSVYMDAVLRPRIYSKPEIFWQEGWHLELPEDGEPYFNGVVYNEMKGAYSSADTVMLKMLGRVMFPSNTYGRSSGGDPEFIPTLTYEAFLDGHRKYYHPENSFIFLYGKMDLAEKLAFLDTEYLSKYDRLYNEFDIPMQKPLGFNRLDANYMIDPSESEERNAMCGLALSASDFSDRETNLALDLIVRTLTSSNEAPLKKKILEAGLGSDLDTFLYDGILQSYLILLLRKTDAAEADRFLAVLREAIEEICREGIDREALAAALNFTEFTMREGDTGRLPKGLELGINVMDGWLYGADPIPYLSRLDVVDSVRAKLDTDYPEQLLRRVFLDNGHSALVVLHPSKTLAAENAAAEAARAKAYADSLTEAEKEEIREQNRRLKVFQTETDTPEASATLPRLSRTDLGTACMPDIPTEVTEKDGMTYLYHPLSTGGIVYAHYYFDVSDFTLEELSAASLLTGMMGELSTEAHSPFALQTAVKSCLGDLSVTLEQKDDPVSDFRRVYVHATASALDANADRIVPLLREVLFGTKLDASEVTTLLRQQAIMGEQHLVAAGNRYAMMRAAAALSDVGKADDAIDGYGYYTFVKSALADLGDGSALCAKLEELSVRLFASPCAVSVSGRREIADKLLKPLAENANNSLQKPNKPHYDVQFDATCAIKIPGAVAYDALCADLTAKGYAYDGKAYLLGRILTYDYLWNRVRVQGGAYGCSASVDPYGTFVCSSYRDPNVDRTLDVFLDTVSYLKAFAPEEVEMDGYIVGVIASFDRPIRPKAAAALADTRYFCGITEQRRQAIRSDVLKAQAEDIRALVPSFEDLSSVSRICVVGAAEKVADSQKSFDLVI